MARFWEPETEKPRLLDDEEGGVLFLSSLSSSSSGYGYASFEKQRQRLPVYKYRTAILYLVESHATTIVVGETGSGKTTQILQYLKEAGWADGGRVMACMQPRRLAVQAVASRVAEEIGVKLGEEVGYTIRFEDISNPDVTRIKFLTDEVLLREMMDDPLLTNKRHRPVEGEELIPRLEPTILSVEGRGFNVQIHYVEEPVQDYVQAAVSTVLLIHDQEPQGDILVFRTGQDDIDVAVKLLTEEARSNGKRLIILPLYSGLSRAEQGIVYVVDSGFSKQRFYNPISDIENLVVAPISKASARQRTGRAGRLRPGKCCRNSRDLEVKSCFLRDPVLYSLGVLDDGAKLTSPVGFQVAEIPLELMISKMILASNELGCSEEIITIAAVLSIQSIWFSGRGVQRELDEAKLRFAAAEGDHVTFLNIYKGFLQSGKSSKWCHNNFINYHAIKKVMEIREQLKRIALRLGIVLRSCERDMQLVRKAVTAGFFANACRLEVMFNL
ncbi:hypothetical protein PTKIN_Ptkin01aG0109800 [Pterospermum kingtungense]